MQSMYQYSRYLHVSHMMWYMYPTWCSTCTPKWCNAYIYSAWCIITCTWQNGVHAHAWCFNITMKYFTKFGNISMSLMCLMSCVWCHLVRFDSEAVLSSGVPYTGDFYELTSNELHSSLVSLVMSSPQNISDCTAVALTCQPKGDPCLIGNTATNHNYKLNYSQYQNAVNFIDTAYLCNVYNWAVM